LAATVAGAPQSPTMIARMRELGGRIVHVYGLTELYGPYTVDEWQPQWDGLPAEQQARQGVGMVRAEPARVVDDDVIDVPRDGVTVGEIAMRGNNLMNGYFTDEDATAAAFRDGVMPPDGYVELRGRAKDIVICGGENIFTVEVEHAIESHPAVLEGAVVDVPDKKWGARPKAFVVHRPRTDVSEADLIAHVRLQIARFKASKAVEFVDALPRMSSG
jgi:fatty-acyl-CoA synthase